MRRLSLLILAVGIVLAGCKSIEGGYEANKDKQSQKMDKMMSEE